MVKIRLKRKSNSAKMKQLKATALKVNKALGKSGAVFLGTEHKPFTRMDTGIIALNYVLGGGIVRGQTTVFSGEDSTAKTTASLVIAAAVQREGGTVVFVAGEGFDQEWAEAHGVDLESLLVVQADTGDVALESAMTLIEEAPVDLLIIDSLQSLGTTRELEGGVDEEAYGNAGSGQLWGRVMRRTYAAMNGMKQGEEPAIILISQVRSAIGKRGFKGMAPEPESTGIWAVKHWKAAEIRFKKGAYDYDGDKEKRVITRREFKVICLKNKTAKQGRQSAFDMYPQELRVDNKATVLRLAKAYGLIETKGAWMKGYGIKSQGEPKFFEKMTDSIMKKMSVDVMREADK